MEQWTLVTPEADGRIASCEPPDGSLWENPAGSDRTDSPGVPTARDISNTGIRISVAGDQMVPPTFNFVSAKSGGLGRRARVKWRCGNEIGAEFF